MGTTATNSRSMHAVPSVSTDSAIRPGHLKIDLLARGFELAYFLLPDRNTAIEVLIGALSKVRTKTVRDSKRAYWRDKFLKRQITRISQEDHDALQWLIYFESDAREREQEAQGNATQEDMAIRYAKTLVKISTTMSSFYVNIAIHRLLHSYSTSDAQTFYETITNSYRAADEYRRAKRSLMLKIAERFSSRLTLEKSDYGELRYQLAKDQEAFRTLVRQCLEIFTPWSTWNMCPFAGTETSIGPLDLAERVKRLEQGDRDKVEIVRCHFFIDPVCQVYIANSLGLAAHSSKQAIPSFHVNDHRDMNAPPRKPDTPLTDTERKHIAEILQSEDSRRQRVVARVLVARIDGVEVARLGIHKDQDIQFAIPAGSQLLELWTEDGQGLLLLATHLMQQTDSNDPLSVAIPAGSDRRAHASIIPPSTENSGSCVITVKKSESRKPYALRGRPRWLGLSSSFAAYAGALLLAAALVTLWYGARSTLIAHRNPTKAQIGSLTETTRGTSSTSSTVAQNTTSAPVFHLTPDDLMTRGDQSTPGRVIALPASPCIINLELALSEAAPYRVVLTQLDHEQPILIRDVSAKNVHGSVTIPIPSRLLVPNQYYRVRISGKTGNNERTFTFSTSADR